MSLAKEDGCSPTIAKQPQLDCNHEQQASSDKELMKLVAVMW